MPLVTYPDSDEDQETSHAATSTTTTEPASKLKRASITPLPPLPTSFHDLYASNVRSGVNDDPSLHGGRKRQTPHVEGNWPTHVYLEWHPKPDAVELLRSMITRIADDSSKVHTLLQSDLGTPLPLHVSLSRSLALQTDQRDDFLARVRSHLGGVAVRPFDVRFGKVAWYPNHDRTRWFLSLSVQRPEGDALNKLLNACNDACYEMKQPELYVPSRIDTVKRKKPKRMKTSSSPPPAETPDCSDSFHISLAWSLQPQSLAGGAQEVAQPEELSDLSTTFDSVKVKIGNVVSSLPLHSSKISLSTKHLLG